MLQFTLKLVLKNLFLRISFVFLSLNTIFSCSTQTKLLPSSSTMCSNGELSVDGVCNVMPVTSNPEIGSEGYWAASNSAKSLFKSTPSLIAAYKNTTSDLSLSSTVASFSPSSIASADKTSGNMVFSRLSQLTLHTLFDIKYANSKLQSNTTNYANVITATEPTDYASIASSTTLATTAFANKSKIAIIGEGVAANITGSTPKITGLTSATVVNGTFSGTTATNLANINCESGTCAITQTSPTGANARSTALASIMMSDISNGSTYAGYSPDSALYSYDVYKDVTDGSIYNYLNIKNVNAAIDNAKVNGITTLNFAYNLQKLTNESMRLLEVNNISSSEEYDDYKYVNAIDNFFYKPTTGYTGTYHDDKNVDFLSIFNTFGNYLAANNANIIVTNTGVGLYGAHQGSSFNKEMVKKESYNNYIGTNFPVFDSNKTTQEGFVYDSNGNPAITGSSKYNIQQSTSIIANSPNDKYYQYSAQLPTDQTINIYVDGAWGNATGDNAIAWNSANRKNYNSFVPGLINKDYSSIVNGGGLLVSAVSSVGVQGTNAKFEGIVANTLSCGAFGNFCITVPVSDTQKVWNSATQAYVNMLDASKKSVDKTDDNGDITSLGQYGTVGYNEIGSAILTSVVDNVRKIFTKSSYAGTDEGNRSDIVNFIKQNLTDKKYGYEVVFTNAGIDSLSSGFKDLYGFTNGSNSISRSKGVMFSITEASDTAAIATLEKFINNMGYKDVIVGYIDNAKGTDIGLTNIAEKDGLGEIKITATNFATAFAALSKFLVADDIKIKVGTGTSAVTYLNGKEVYTIKNTAGDVLFYCSNATCKDDAGNLDPSKVVSSNIFGLGILNTSEDISNKYRILTNNASYTSTKLALVPSSVVGGAFNSNAFNTSISNVNTKIVDVNGASVYSYSSNLSDTIQNQNVGGAFNDAAFFMQSNFNTRKFSNKSVNLFGLNINLGTSTISDVKSNPIAKAAMLSSGFQSPFNSQVSNYNIGGEFGKFSFSSFSGSTANLRDNSNIVGSTFAISEGNYAGTMQINNFSDILGFGAKGGKFGYKLNGSNSVSFNYASSNLSQNTYYGGVAQKFNNFSSVSINSSGEKASTTNSFGVVQERGGFLGTVASGAFGVNANTVFASSSGEVKFNESYFAGYKAQYGVTKVRDAVGILQNFSALQSLSYNFFGGKNKIFSKNDSLTLGINSPLSIINGSVDVNNGYNTQNLNLANKNRWIAAELGYSIKNENTVSKTYSSFGFNIAKTQNKYNIANANDSAALINANLYW